MICNIFLVGDSEKGLNDAPSIPLSMAIDETISVKRWGGRREKYITSLRLYLRQFARGRESDPVDAISAEDIRNWFLKRKETPMTQLGNIGRLSSFFTFCWRRGYITENPVERIERPYVDRVPPKILTIRQCAKILIWTKRNRPDFLAYIVLTLLAGVRPDEAALVKWSDIDLRGGWVRIDAAASKVRMRRLARLSLAACAWLRLAKQLDSTLPLRCHGQKRYALERLREAMGFTKWPKDILRHTAASYLCAVYPTADVSDWLGNSVSILRAHYKELCPREDGRRFRCLLPSAAMVNRLNGLH